MHAVFATFSLDGITDAAYLEHADAVAVDFAAIPGLCAKTWIADPAANRYGALYVYESKEACDAFRSSELAQRQAELAWVRDVQVQEFAVLDGPTAVTRGPVPPVG
jgi:hypothetical protein